MTDDIQNIDVDADEFLDTPKALRDHVKRLQTALAEANKDRDSLRQTVTANALSDVLSEFKAPSRVKRDLLSDGIDPLNDKAVEKWLAENGDDYAKAAATPPSEPTQEDNQDPAEVAAHQQLHSTELHDAGDMGKLEAALAELTPDASREQVLEVYKKHGL